MKEDISASTDIARYLVIFEIIEDCEVSHFEGAFGAGDTGARGACGSVYA
jgi:hypothetical protein